MNEPNNDKNGDGQNELSIDTLEDRLADQALREVLRAETPPDVSSRILAAADRPAESDPTAPTPTRVAAAPASARSSWRDLAVAACLLVLIGGSLCLVVASNYQAQRQHRAVAQRGSSDTENVDAHESLFEPESSSTRERKELHLEVAVAESLLGSDDMASQSETPVEELDLEVADLSTINGAAHRGVVVPPVNEAVGNAGYAEALKVAQQQQIPSRWQLTKPSEQVRSVRTEFGNKSQEYRRKLEANKQAIVAIQDQVLNSREKYEAQVAAVVKQTRARVDQLRETQNELKSYIKFNPEASDGRIVGINQTKGTVWINLGSADGLRAATSFAVYPHNSTTGDFTTGAGKKASIEVVRVVNEHLAEARITHLDPRDPITRDDTVFSPHFVPGKGTGPDDPGDQYTRIVENEFLSAADRPLSTFSIDVDTASYANVRQFLLQGRRLPPPDAVRIEELVNYFDYDYAGPQDETPFASHMEVAACPWQPKHRLLRIALKGKEVDYRERPNSNLVFLIDVSGSMQDSNKLPLCVAGMKLLAGELNENDRVAIVVYANSEGLVLPSTPGARKDEIIAALDRLRAGGSTNGGAGIQLAYQVAQDNFVKGGINRVILCTDGDFNVGTTSTGQLQRMAEEKAKTGVFLTVLGFGRGNLNDAMMETISNKGNGNYAYIDGLTEAKKVLIEQMSGTLMTIAKDVKIQVEFNPAEVFAYRLIGYENRVLAAEDFNDDLKDAGEIGAGHTVTALYEIVPHPKKDEKPTAETGDVDALKYQRPAGLSKAAANGELLTLKLRYKQPDGEVSRLLQFPLKDDGKKFGQASEDFKFASSVAAFGMLLRGSRYAGNTTIDAVLEIAQASQGEDPHRYRAEFLEMAREAKELSR